MTTPAAPPPVSAFTRQVLDEAVALDRRLVVETGGWCLYDIQREIARASPDWIEAAVLDGLRWRHFWLPDSVLWRQELEARERARVAVETSHALAGGMRWSCIGPTHADLVKLRATPAWVRRCTRPGCPNTITVHDAAVVKVLCHTHQDAASEARPLPEAG